MKKFVAILLTLMLVLGMTAAVAEPVTTDNPYTDMPTITLTKTYNLTNAGTISPAENFAFSAPTCTDVADAGVGVTTANAPVPTIGNGMRRRLVGGQHAQVWRKPHAKFDTALRKRNRRGQNAPDNKFNANYEPVVLADVEPRLVAQEPRAKGRRNF